MCNLYLLFYLFEPVLRTKNKMLVDLCTLGVDLTRLPPEMSILFLNILTLLAPTQSADNPFHSFTVLCENENFLKV